MPTWFIELQGDRFDTDEFAYWFPNGAEVFAIAEGDTRLLTGPAFEDCNDPAEAQALAELYVDEFLSVITLLQAGVKRPTIGKLFRELPDGTREAFSLLQSRVTVRGKLRATLTLSSSPALPTQAQVFLEAARTSRHLRIALSILALPHATWPHLYRCLEEIEQYLNSKVSISGFCADSERERFTWTANNGDSAGLDARHRLDKFSPPPNPMTLAEARGFVTGLAQMAVSRAVTPGQQQDAV